MSTPDITQARAGDHLVFKESYRIYRITEILNGTISIRAPESSMVFHYRISELVNQLAHILKTPPKFHIGQSVWFLLDNQQPPTKDTVIAIEFHSGIPSIQDQYRYRTTHHLVSENDIIPVCGKAQI